MNRRLLRVITPQGLMIALTQEVEGETVILDAWIGSDRICTNLAERLCDRAKLAARSLAKRDRLG